MYSFFVLGQIPGTSITISFTMWLGLCLFIAASYLGAHYHRQRQQVFSLDPTIGADDQTAIAH